MTDYQYLKENNLFEAHKQFLKMCNEGYLGGPIEEAGEQEDDPNAMPQDPNAMGGAPADGGQGAPADPNAMGGDPNAMGGDPNAMGGAPADGGQGAPADPNAMGGDSNAMGGDPNAMGGDPNAMGGDPNAMPPDDGGQDEGEQDDVLDVDDLTNAQEKLNKKQNSIGKDLGNVDDRITNLMGAVDKMEKMISSTNSEIANLKGELQKRVPTRTEKLNLRSLDSYPFNITPAQYWQDKGRNSNYSAYGDNNEPTTQEYHITNDDVDNMDDKTVSDSFELDDDLNQTMKKIFEQY
jgi:hypothetical protein